MRYFLPKENQKIGFDQGNNILLLHFSSLVTAGLMFHHRNTHYFSYSAKSVIVFLMSEKKPDCVRLGRMSKVIVLSILIFRPSDEWREYSRVKYHLHFCKFRILMYKSTYHSV